MRILSLEKISLCALLLTAAAPSMLRADQINSGGSWDAAPWLKLPASARTAGMGDAFAGMGDDITSFRVNPAGIVQMDGPQILLTHNAWFQGVSVEHFAGGMPLDSDSGMGLSFDYLNLGSVDAYTISGNSPVANGTVNPRGFNIGLGYGRALTRNFDAGVVVKYLQQDIANSTGGIVGADVGLMAHGIIPRIALGVALENIGQNLQGSALPTVLKIGLAYKSSPLVKRTHAFNVALDADFSMTQTQAAAIEAGVEYWYNGVLALRAGDQISADKQGTGMDGLTFGAGVNLGPFQLNYAFMSNGYLGSSNLVSLLIKTDQGPPPPKLTSQEVRIVEHVNRNVQFSFDSAYLKSEFNVELDQLADILKKRPKDHVLLTGYASNEGTPEHNQELSEWRANEVRDRLRAHGVPEEQVISLGAGETNTIVSGGAEKELSPNRRVEIKIIQPRPGTD